MLTSRGLGVVLGDLASMGFDARWGVLGAADVGANHQRDRIWIVARQRHILSHPKHYWNRWREQQSQSPQETIATNTRCQPTWPDQGLQPKSEIPIRKDVAIICGEISDTTGIRPQGQGQHEQPFCTAQSANWQANILEPIGSSDFWSTEPDVGRVADGVAARVDRLKAIGNGQVPLCAATAFRILSQDL